MLKSGFDSSCHHTASAQACTGLCGYVFNSVFVAALFVGVPHHHSGRCLSDVLQQKFYWASQPSARPKPHLPALPP
jgi:hypothetical protein